MRFLSILAVAAVFSLAGCGDKDKDKKPVTPPPVTDKDKKDAPVPPPPPVTDAKPADSTKPTTP